MSNLDGRPLGTVIAVVGASQIVSTLALFVEAQWEESFATISNVAYVFSGCYHNFHTKHNSGSLSNPAFPLLFLGVSSFAFHGEPSTSSEKHTMDIFGGWVLVLHLACTAISTAMAEVVSEIQALRPFQYLVDAAFVILLSSGLLAIAVVYAEIYRNQLLFYMVCASTSVFFSLLIRIRLSKLEPVSVVIFMFESVTVLALAVSAVFLQGELVGKRLSNSTNKQMYSLFHGMWHIQLSLVVSLLNVLYADQLQQSQQPLRRQSHITNIEKMDVVGLLIFLIQSVALLAMKELSYSFESVRVVLCVGSLLHGLHISSLVYIPSTTKKATNDVQQRKMNFAPTYLPCAAPWEAGSGASGASAHIFRVRMGRLI